MDSSGSVGRVGFCGHMVDDIGSKAMTNNSLAEIPGEAFMGMAIRLLFLGTHYRKPLDFTDQKIAEMEKIWRRWIQKAEAVHEVIPTGFLEDLCDIMNNKNKRSFL